MTKRIYKSNKPNAAAKVTLIELALRKNSASEGVTCDLRQIFGDNRNYEANDFFELTVIHKNRFHIIKGKTNREGHFLYLSLRNWSKMLPRPTTGKNGKVTVTFWSCVYKGSK